MYEFQAPSVETQIVTAFFETGALSYSIASGTTLEQFSGQIARLARLRQTWPVAVSALAIQLAPQPLASAAGRDRRLF